MNDIAIHLVEAVPVIICLAISFAYFMAGKSESISVRIIKSSHGLLIVIAGIVSIIASKHAATINTHLWLTVFYVIILLALASAFLSLFNYVNGMWHILYLILAPIGLYILFVGQMMIWGDLGF